MKKIILAVMLSWLSLGSSDAQKISSSVANTMQTAAAQQKIACFILLPQQADLAAAADLKTKSEKGHFVWQALQKQAADQADLQRYLASENIFFMPQTIVNAIFAELTPAQINTLALRQDVARILPNLPIQAHFPIRETAPTPTLRASDDTLTWGISKIQANRLWQKGISGQNVSIGGQDTGYDWLHPALLQSYRGNRSGVTADHNYNWHDAIHAQHPLNSDAFNPCGYNLTEPCDDGSHGTHTMGTMAGSKDNNGTHIGVAPQAKWMGCRNMERGWGSPQSYIECFEWFLAPTNLQNQNPDPNFAPHVINNSWGCPTIEGCNSDNFELMRIAVSNLRAAGVVVVVSAGNDGPACNTINNPASIYAESFTIGASMPNDTMASFSSRGLVDIDGSMRAKPNVAAPGVNVRSSVPNQSYSSASGTSMAGPHVAGLVALLISADPTLAGQVARIEELIEKTADPVFSSQICNGISSEIVPNPISGYGLVNAWAALSVIRPDLTSDSPQNTEALRIYPNPTQHSLWLITPFDASIDVPIRIFNPLGQLVWQQNHDFKRIIELDVTALPKGVYYISISSDDRRQPYTRSFYKL
jgi:serine protease AprX